MISSMTGYGRGDASKNRITAIAEVRSVNSRFLEVSSRLPRTIALRESDVKDLIRSKFSRGKVNVIITINRENADESTLKINPSAAKMYYRLLTNLKKVLKIKETITLEHLLKFPEVIEATELEDQDEQEWLLARAALLSALEATSTMRQKEGEELMKDLRQRTKNIERIIAEIEHLSGTRVPEVRDQLRIRIQNLLADQSVMDSKRLELEIALLADKLDVTEECVRFKSHTKFFLEGLVNGESAGRKLNFLVQEMNREANTIGAKTNHADISHMVVTIKEELEKIREQLQNIE